MSKTVIITGGTGIIGRAITSSLLERGDRVIIFSRSPDKKSDNPNLKFAQWDIDNSIVDDKAFAEADAIIHLAGAGVADKRWTAKRKKEIADSRINSGELLVKSLKTIQNKIKVIVSASGIGWYGPDPVIPNPNPFKEIDPPYDDFLGKTCKKWEDSISPVTEQGCRLVIYRTGIVLSKKGGALEEFMKPLKFGLATILSNGKQIISWIHIDDIVQLYLTALDQQQMSGVYNAVSPAPVSNKELMTTLASKMRGKNFISVHVPSFALKLALGEMSIEVLKSTTASADKVCDTGFTFQYPSIDKALADLVQQL